MSLIRNCSNNENHSRDCIQYIYPKHFYKQTKSLVQFASASFHCEKLDNEFIVQPPTEQYVFFKYNIIYNYSPGMTERTNK